MRGNTITLALAALVLILVATIGWQWYAMHQMQRKVIESSKVHLDEASLAVEQLRQTIDNFEKNVPQEDAKRITDQLRQRIDDYQKRIPTKEH